MAGDNAAMLHATVKPKSRRCIIHLQGRAIPGHASTPCQSRKFSKVREETGETPHSVSPASLRLQGAQVVQQELLMGSAEVGVIGHGGIGLAATARVVQDRCDEARRAAIVAAGIIRCPRPTSGAVRN